MRVRVAPVALLVLAACGNEPGGSLVPGSWGGSGAYLVAQGRTASFQFNCASGVVNNELALDGDGEFQWTGTYTRANPAGGAPDGAHAATYAGVVQGHHMTLSVDVPDIPGMTGSFQLTLGSPPQLALCPAPPP